MIKNLAWSAGFLDAEGCIHIQKKGERVFNICISASQCVPEPLEKLKSIFGGSVSASTRKGSEVKEFQWSISHLKAENALNKLLPYLVNKREQARVALEFRRIQVSKWQNNRKVVSRDLAILYRTKLTELKNFRIKNKAHEESWRGLTDLPLFYSQK